MPPRRGQKKGPRMGDSTQPVEAGQIRQLESELLGLRRSMRTRSLIEQGKGRLAERHGIDPEEAFHRLVRASQADNRRVAELAAELMGSDVDVACAPPGWQRRTLPLRGDATVVGSLDLTWSDGRAPDPDQL